MVVIILSGSVLTVATYADDIRAARLRQHGLPVPKDPTWAALPIEPASPRPVWVVAGRPRPTAGAAMAVNYRCISAVRRPTSRPSRAVP